MATLDFIRSVETDLQTKEDMRFNPVFVIARDDEAAVDFTAKTIKFEVFTGSTVLVTLTSGTEITISTATLTFDKVFSELEKRGYKYRMYNDTDKVGIMHGKLYVK
jgi:hypothetical protein